MSSLGPHADMACPAEGPSTGGTAGAELPFSAGGSAGLGVTACHVSESRCSIHMSPKYLPPEIYHYNQALSSDKPACSCCFLLHCPQIPQSGFMTERLPAHGAYPCNVGSYM